jgi:transcriptional regulator with XRE-family HTH domain
VTNIETIREYRREALSEDAARAAGEAALVRLANRLYALRESMHLTQEELATRAALDQASISDIENGDANPTTRTLGRLASGLDVDVGTLLDSRPFGTRYGAAVVIHDEVKWQGTATTEANRTTATKIKVASAKAVAPARHQKVRVG